MGLITGVILWRYSIQMGYMGHGGDHGTNQWDNINP